MQRKNVFRAIALFLLVAMFLSLGVFAAAEGEQTAALEIYAQSGEGEAVLAKAYTAEELDALKETKADGYGYVYFKGDAANAVAVTEFVTLDALFADAGVEFGEGAKLDIVCTDGPYTKGDFSYEDLSARGVDMDGAAVPTAIAIAWNNGSLADGTVADIAATAKNTGSLRLVSGMTAEEKENSSAAGKRMPSGIVSITVVTPEKTALEIYAQTGEGEKTLAKSYTASELDALKETKADGYGYVFFKGDAANAVAVTEFVTLDALFADAGVELVEGGKLDIVCSDGPYTKGDFSYEDLSARGVDMDGAAVPTAIAIAWNNGSLADGTVADIAATAKNTGSLRLVSGMTAAEKESSSAAGKRMPTGVVSITVVTPEEPAGFTDVPEGQYYTEPVAWAVENGITTGYSETEFAPNDKCLRAQVVTFLWRAAGKPAAEGVNPFTDVKEGDYFYDAVLWAVANGITTGCSETEFAPNDNCTRAQVVTFMWRAFGKPAAEGENPFTDVPEGEFYTDAVIWAVANGITTGTSDTTFAPADFCLRGQVVTFLYRGYAEA